jgi:serine/threonine-protein kinase
MAAVYLARDIRHDRFVALKVLRPELGETGAERFLREVRLTARLQHPHILPVFDSGHDAGQLWYTMPYIEGESLRDRLRREAQLPVDVAIRLALEVADALGQAHEQGVLHRDIKPENILLSRGHAVVADFGLARALAASVGGALAAERLTDAGLAVGTPAYMSPEQLLDGERIDARSDVYGLGCVLYEMLAGEPPYTGRTPQAIMARRLVEAVPSVRCVRETVSPALDHALATALARVPADRFDTMAAFAGALQNANRPVAVPAPPAADPGSGLTALEESGKRERGSRRRAIWVGALVCGGLAIAVLAFFARERWNGRVPTLLAAGVLQERDPLLIADFRSAPADTALGTMVTEVFRVDLAQSPAVTLVSSTRVAEALTRMKRPAVDRLDIALARELAIREGIKAVVSGDVLRSGSRLIVSLQLIHAATGEVLLAHRETADDSTEIVTALDRLSRRLRESIGESLRTVRAEPPLGEVTTASLEALRKYTQAVRAARQSDIVQAIALLEEAIALDSGFAMAYTDLGRALAPPYSPERRVWALTKAFELRDRLPARERYVATAAYYGEVTYELDKAANAHRARLDLHPTDVDAVASLAGVYMKLRQHERAEEAFRRAVALDSLDASFPVGLAQSQMDLGKPREALATVTRALRSFPDNPEVEWWAIQFVASSGAYGQAEARARALRGRLGQEPYWRQWTGGTLAALAALRGRVDEAAEFMREAMRGAEDDADIRAYYGWAGQIALYEIRYKGRPQRALQEMERALHRFPLDSTAPLDRPYLTLATVYALAGQAGRSREILKEYERTVDPRLREASALLDQSHHGVFGELALAEGRVDDAVDHLRLAVSRGLCVPCGLEALGRAYEAAGQVDSAIAVYRRRIEMDHVQRFVLDAVELPLIYQRLGDLYAHRGDRTHAREYYARLLELWKDCDPDLRPVLTEVRRRLAEVQEEPPS